MWLTLVCASGCNETVEIPGATFGYEETGSYETGYTVVDVGGGLLENGECVAPEKPGAFGYMYQCQGYYVSTFHYNFDNELYTINIPRSTWFILGNEPYEFSKVMACCGPYNDQLDFDQQPIYAENCILDAREGACSGLITALSQHIAKMLPGAHKNALKELADYLSPLVSQCVYQLGDGYPLNPYNNLVASWYIDKDWDHPDLADDAELKLNVNITGVDAPESPASCTGLNFNNTWQFYSDPEPLTSRSTSNSKRATAVCWDLTMALLRSRLRTTSRPWTPLVLIHIVRTRVFRKIAPPEPGRSIQ